MCIVQQKEEVGKSDLYFCYVLRRLIGAILVYTK